MNRRGFLSLLSAAAAVPILPEPSSCVIFLPPKGGWGITHAGFHSLSIHEIMREALRISHERMNFVSTINREYDDEFGRGLQWEQSMSDALLIRKPLVFNRIKA